MKKFTVPFKTEENLEGLVRYENQTLSFEFQTHGFELPTKVIYIGIVKSSPGVKKTTLSIADVEDAGFKKGVFTGRAFWITFSKLDPLEGYPGKSGSEIVFHIDKRHEEIAKNFVSRLCLDVQDFKYSELQAKVDAARAQNRPTT